MAGYGIAGVRAMYSPGYGAEDSLGRLHQKSKVWSSKKPCYNTGTPAIFRCATESETTEIHVPASIHFREKSAITNKINRYGSVGDNDLEVATNHSKRYRRKDARERKGQER